MIYTMVENVLRKKLYGMFWNRLHPMIPDVWQAKIIQCVEQNTQNRNGQWYAPDRYHVSIYSDAVENAGQFLEFRADVVSFLNMYLDETEYKTVRPVTVEIDPMNGQYNHNLDIKGYFSELPEIISCIDVTAYKIPENSGRYFFFNLSVPGKYYIGRSYGIDVRLEHEYVSQHHAVLSVNDSGECYIQDLRSRNGTIINKKRIEPDKQYKLMLPRSIQIAKTFELLVNLKLQ